MPQRKPSRVYKDDCGLSRRQLFFLALLIMPAATIGYFFGCVYHYLLRLRDKILKKGNNT